MLCCVAFSYSIQFKEFNCLILVGQSNESLFRSKNEGHHVDYIDQFLKKPRFEDVERSKHIDYANVFVEDRQFEGDELASSMRRSNMSAVPRYTGKANVDFYLC